jgi:DNA mismatch endonuclease, patch repair protein
MSRIRGFDTSLERLVEVELRKRGLPRFQKNVLTLPGRPDFVFRRHRLVVFVDGDFWHGFQFPSWQGRLSPYWQQKIARNRARDRRNFARLRRAGWTVIRIWEHQLKRDLSTCIDRIALCLDENR